MRLGKLFRERFLVVGLAVVAPVALVLGLVLPGSANAKVTPQSTMNNWWTTFYGFIDNSPPGTQIFTTKCHTPGGAHVTAATYPGENGTYKDPVVMAWPHKVPVGANQYCQIGYVPDLKKYFIHADLCDPCGGNNSTHWDLWMGGDSGSTHNPEKAALLNCENKWTVHTTVILNPPTNEPVDTTPLFTPPTTCHGGAGDGGGGGS
jgi:hypothetical protein